MSESDPSAPPDRPYRWVILGVSALIIAIVVGQIVNGISVYFLPLESAMGWSRGDIALINSAGLVGLALGSLLMGFAVERFGVRRVAVFGISVAGLATLTASRADALWQFYALFFLAGLFGAGSIIGPLIALIGSWFTRGAGLAIGLAAAGQAVGQGGVPFTGALLIDRFGWRDALAVQAVVTLVALLPLAVLLREAPVRASDRAVENETPSGLSNTALTVWLSAATLCCCTCMAVPLIHLVPLIEDRGIGPTEAGSVLFTMMLVAIAGRVAFGKLADVIGALPAYFAASAWQTVMVFGFIAMGSLQSFYAYAVIYGFGYAGVMTGVLVTARSIAAPARRASTTGVALAFGYIGHGLGGWQGGYVFDLTGTYGWTFGNAAIAGMLNLCLVAALWWTVGPRGEGRRGAMAAA